MVAGGLPKMSYITREMPFTSFTMRRETRSSCPSCRSAPVWHSGWNKRPCTPQIRGPLDVHGEEAVHPSLVDAVRTGDTIAHGERTFERRFEVAVRSVAERALTRSRLGQWFENPGAVRRVTLLAELTGRRGASTPGGRE